MQSTDQSTERGPRVATFSRYHTAVVNPDGTIDIHRRPAAHTTDNEQQKACAAFQNINSRNAEFWAAREGMPGQ